MVSSEYLCLNMEVLALSEGLAHTFQGIGVYNTRTFPAKVTAFRILSQAFHVQGLTVVEPTLYV